MKGNDCRIEPKKETESNFCLIVYIVVVLGGMLLSNHKEHPVE